MEKEKIIRNLKNLSHLFYFLMGFTAFLYIFAPMVIDVFSKNAKGGFSDGVSIKFIIFGIIFFLIGLIFSTVANDLIKKFRNHSSSSSSISVTLESKSSYGLLFKRGNYVMIILGLMLIMSVVVFWDGGRKGLMPWYLGFLATLVIFAISNWILAVIRYFKK